MTNIFKIHYLSSKNVKALILFYSIWFFDEGCGSTVSVGLCF